MGDKHSLKVWLSYRIYSLNKSTITTRCRNGIGASTGYYIPLIDSAQRVHGHPNPLSFRSS